MSINGREMVLNQDECLTHSTTHPYSHRLRSGSSVSTERLSLWLSSAPSSISSDHVVSFEVQSQNNQPHDLLKVYVKCELCRGLFPHDSIASHRQTCGSSRQLRATTTSSTATTYRTARNVHSGPQSRTSRNTTVTHCPVSSRNTHYTVQRSTYCPAGTSRSVATPYSRSLYSFSNSSNASGSSVSRPMDIRTFRECHLCGVTLSREEEYDHFYAHTVQGLDEYVEGILQQTSQSEHDTMNTTQENGNFIYRSSAERFSLASTQNRERPFETFLTSFHEDISSASSRTTSPGINSNLTRISSSALDRLPSFCFAEFLGAKSSTEGCSQVSTSCVICLENYQAKDRLRRLPCFHMFHVACIDRWLKRSKLCPFCKTPVY